MPLEQEVMGLLIGGFSGIMVISIFIILLIWVHAFGYIWILMHLLLVSGAVYFALNAFAFDYQHPMASEEISLRIGVSGAIWGLSMVCLIIAIFFFSKVKNHVAS